MRLPTPLRLIVDNAPTGEILKDEGIALALAHADPRWKAAWKEIAYETPFELRIPVDPISHGRPCKVLVRTAWL